MNAYDNDLRVEVNAWGSTERDVTYRIAAEHLTGEHPLSDLNWDAFEPGDSIEVKFIQDGSQVHGWVVTAENDDVSKSVRLTDWGAYRSADAALAVVLGDPR